MVDENGDVIIGDFVVGREGFGMVKFFGEFNVAGLNLDEIGNNYFLFGTLLWIQFILAHPVNRPEIVTIYVHKF
jgi:hypothetical protein